MWTSTRFTTAVGCRYPIVQGPMGGGHSTPELVAAVCNAGGLGSLGVYHLEPEAIVAAGEAIRRLTARPFAMNLWVPRAQEDGADGPPREWRRVAELLKPYLADLGLPPLPPMTEEPPAGARSFEARPAAVIDFAAQMEAVLAVRPAVFSFIFGTLPGEVMAAVKERSIVTVGTATTVDEAEALEASGADLICASGFEAGGHRGSFLGPPEQSLMGTLALVPQVVRAVRTPVIAAGGIGDGRGIAAVLALGAEAAQLGTAFLLCDESGAAPPHRAALADRRRARRTALTRAFSGRLARVIATRYVDDMAAHTPELLPYPLQGAATRELRLAAARAGRADLMALFSGQSAPLGSVRPAAGLVAELVAEVEETLRRLAPEPAEEPRAGS